MNKVSVLTASYGHAAYVGAAVESVLGQTWGAFRYLVCDDGSQDGSWDIIQSYAARDERIRAFSHENSANLGLAATVQALLHRTVRQGTRSATWDMMLDVLYPGNRAEDKAFLSRLLQGRLEKIFRSPLRALARFHLQRLYGRHPVRLECLPLENI